MIEKDNSTLSPKMKEKHEEIIFITDGFCHTYLDEEYRALCRKMTTELSQKQHAPLLNGRAQSWAAGILYVLGRINYLFDKSFKPYVSVADICTNIRVSKATITNKAREIEHLLDMSPLATEWYLPARLQESPLPWLISINGLIIDARTLPREMQEDAYRLGLIPHLP